MKLASRGDDLVGGSGGGGGLIGLVVRHGGIAVKIGWYKDGRLRRV
jgi:hypothetical protein